MAELVAEADHHHGAFPRFHGIRDWNVNHRPFGHMRSFHGEIQEAGRAGYARVVVADRLLAQALFRAGQASTVIAIELPASRAMMHLGTVLTMIDRDTFVQYPYLDRQLRSWTLTPDETGRAVAVTRNRDLWGTVADVLGVGEVTVLSTDEDIRGDRTGTVGRRDQLSRRGPGRHRRVRAQRSDQHHAAQARHRGGHHRRQRAMPRPRQPAVHDLPDRAGPRLRRTR
jgi:Arginine deiminase